jgi:hypothetical protein
MPIGPAGNLDPAVIDSLLADGSCLLPDRGAETIHHVHAEDVAGLHRACLDQPDAAAGQSFNSVCTQAFTLRGYAEVVARHFGHEPRLEFVPWDEFVTRVDAEHAGTTLEHIGRAPLYSMEKARGQRRRDRVSATTAGSVQLVIPTVTTIAAVLRGERLSAPFVVVAVLVAAGMWVARPARETPLSRFPQRQSKTPPSSSTLVADNTSGVVGVDGEAFSPRVTHSTARGLHSAGGRCRRRGGAVAAAEGQSPGGDDGLGARAAPSS